MTEIEVAEVTGVSRRILRTFRSDLQPGVHFIETRSGITYTLDGLDVLRSRGIDIPKTQPPAVGPHGGDDEAGHGPAPETALAGLPDAEAGKKLARVTRTFHINKRVLEAQVDGGGEVRVRVRDSDMFVKGQEIPIRPAGDGTPMWVLACRHPHIRGRLRW